MIDALEYTRGLIEVGLTQEQAEFMARSQLKMISNNVATKLDLTELRHHIKEETSGLRVDMNAMNLKLSSEINLLYGEVKDIRIEIKGLELRLVKSLGALMIFLFGTFSALQAYLS